MSSAYERELKGVLSGEEDVIRRLTKAYGPEVQKNYLKVLARPWLVVRAAGSLGVDLVAMRGDVSFPIEVKSNKKPLVHFSDASGKNQDQADRMAAACARATIIPIYAFRLKAVRGEDPWRILALPVDGLTGRVQVLYDRLPKVARTDAGRFVLRWEEGLPLNRFIDYLCG